MSQPMPAHMKRYTIHFGAAMIAYMIVLFASISVLNRIELADWQRLIVAVLPVFPTLYALHAFVVAFRGSDEFHRRIIGEAILWAAGVVGFGSFTYGFAELAIDLPRIHFIWILPALIATYGVAQAILYRSLK